MSQVDLVQLSLLLDGELSPAEAAVLRERLRDEPELRQAYERLQRLSTVALLPTAEDQAAAAVAMKAVGVGAPRPKWPWVLLGVVGLVVGAALWGSGAPPSTPEPLAPVAPPAVTPVPPPPAPSPVAAVPAPPREPPVFLLSAGAPPEKLPADQRVRVKGEGPVSFAGVDLKLKGDGDVVLAVVNQAGLVDAPPGTRSTETFVTPSGDTVVAFVLAGELMATSPRRAALDDRDALIMASVGKRHLVRWSGAEAVRVTIEDPRLATVRLVTSRRLETRGLREGRTRITIEFASGKKRQWTLAVVTGSAIGEFGKYTGRELQPSLGDRIPLELSGVARFGVADPSLVDVQRTAEGLEVRALANKGMTILDIWFQDGTTTTWRVQIEPLEELDLAAPRGGLGLKMLSGEYRLALAPGDEVTVEPAEAGELLRLDATHVRFTPQAVGSVRLVITPTVGPRRSVSMMVVDG